MTENVCTISPTVEHYFITVSLPTYLIPTADIEETKSTATDVLSLQGEEVQQGKKVQQGKEVQQGERVQQGEEFSKVNVKEMAMTLVHKKKMLVSKLTIAYT